MVSCTACAFENPVGMKFCGNCGVPLNLKCSNCAFENPPGFKFCGNCGISLTGSPQEDTPTSPSPTRLPTFIPEAERRQLTVMFCDLVGSTALSHQLDPEELHKVIGAYQAVCVSVVTRFEGHVAQYLGDGLLVYFGYPAAHEDDAQRAVRTGLGIIEAIERLSSQLNQEMNLQLQLRIGIHTGLVVVGQVGSGNKHEQLALGDTPNIAARLQSLADPNTIVISEATHRLASPYFSTQAQGAKLLTGIAEPLDIYQILHEQEINSRLEAAAMAGLTPLVGREQELSLLLARWEQVQEGAGQVVTLNGDGGIGKSRLIHGFKDRLAQTPYLWLETHCSPYHENSAFFPLIELLQQILQFERNDSPIQQLGKIEAMLAQRATLKGQSGDLSIAVPLLANLLSVPLSNDYRAVNLPPHHQKQLALEILLASLLDVAQEQPVLFIIEDLHWVDPSTLEFINLLIDQGTVAPVLVILTYRPAFTPTWAVRSNLTQLTLSRLTKNQVTEMITSVTDTALPNDLLNTLVEKTDGVPLFVEEMTKMVEGLEVIEGQDLSASLVIPSTLQDLLMARLDRLTQAKEVAQLAATLGREFDYTVLQKVSGLDDHRLRQDLAELVEAELLYQRGLPPQASYIFKHALIQEAAYRTLLRSRRQQYHQTIGRVLAEQFPDIAAKQPELLARHFTVAGELEPAATYWQQAGQRAALHSANKEAIEHLTTGLDLLEGLPETTERIQQQLVMQITLGVSYLMTKGYAATEVEQVYAKAWALCQKAGNVPQRAPALYGLWLFYLVRADYEMARRLGDQLMGIAQESHDPIYLMEAHKVQGLSAFYLGELLTAHDHLTKAIELHDPQAKGFQNASYSGANAGVACLSHLALVLWHLGYPEQAKTKAQDALNLANMLGHPYSKVFAEAFIAWLHQYRREPEPAIKHAEAAIAASSEQAFELSLPFCMMFRGWGLVMQGDDKAGLPQLRQGLDTFLATGAEQGHLYYSAMLAEVYGQRGQAQAGLRLLNEALRIARKSGERLYEAEAYRLKGEFRLQAGAELAEVEPIFKKALTVARQQQSKALALRAAMSLSRVWHQQGKPEDAVQLLQDSYNGFSEGHDTPDLQQAQALLNQLGFLSVL